MMTHEEAIESLINTCNELKDVIEQLQEENAFLVDTIEKNNLGQTKSERRSLLVKNERYKKESQLAIEKANRIREEYESKMSEANSRLADARKKQSEIDLYINNEAESLSQLNRRLERILAQTVSRRASGLQELRGKQESLPIAQMAYSPVLLFHSELTCWFSRRIGGLTNCKGKRCGAETCLATARKLC